MDAPREGLLIIGHGTRDPQGTEQFFALAAELGRQLSPMPVQPCLLEFQEPTIAQAWEMLVGRGVRHIHVAPLLLFAAGHARADIPEITFACAALTPEVTYSQSGPLSRAPSVIRLLQDRIDEAANRSKLPRDDSAALVLVGRGSYDPCAKADMQFLGEVVARRTGFRQHAVGFYAMAQPALPDVLDQVADRPGVQSVIVQPHLLFQGRLFDAIKQQVDDASKRHPGVRFVMGNYLGPVPEVAEALAWRIRRSNTEL